VIFVAETNEEREGLNYVKKLMVGVGLILCAAVGAFAEDIHGRPLLNFNDHYVYEWTNNADVNAKLTFTLSFDYKCNDQYSQWMHYQVNNYVLYVNAHSVNNHVFYYNQGCSSSFTIQSHNMQLVEAVRAN
jgi:hypothetical protein